MFESFTEDARRAVVLAQQEARLLNHKYIGTEHLLLGLMHLHQGVAASVLDSAGVEVEVVRAEVIGIVGRGNGVPPGHVPFTPRAKRALEQSMHESQRRGQLSIGTEHLLLGLLSEEGGIAVKVLARLGIDRELLDA